MCKPAYRTRELRFKIICVKYCIARKDLFGTLSEKSKAEQSKHTPHSVTRIIAISFWQLKRTA